MKYCPLYLQIQFAFNYSYNFCSEDSRKTKGDYLTCGGCRRKFDLSDLTKFVQHKVLDCNKENNKVAKGKLTLYVNHVDSHRAMLCTMMVV